MYGADDMDLAGVDSVDIMDEIDVHQILGFGEYPALSNQPGTF